jgi:GNAT superfamily N-acetyltransferase
MNALTHIRLLGADDDLVAITDMIHDAYSAHAEKGLRYWGSYQTVEDTVSRFASGKAYVAESGGSIVGTITIQRPQPDSELELYRAPTTRSITQFVVAPSHQGRGIGALLHEQAIASAARENALTLALDTAEPASGLISMYKKWGYEICGKCDWRPLTNYVSILMSRCITDTERARYAL